MEQELNIQIINENVTNYISGINIQNPQISIKDLRDDLTKIIGQIPAIKIKRAPKPINELITKSGANAIKETKVEEIEIFYVDLDNNKPVRMRILF